MALFRTWLLLLLVSVLFGKTLSGQVTRDGLADLRAINLNDSAINLDGNWRFFWNELIDPALPPQPQAALVPFPMRWNKLVLDGQALKAQGFASYQLTVLLQPGKKSLALSMPDVYSSYALYINGKLVLQNGRPDSIESRAIPRWERKLLPLKADEDSLHIVLHIANFWHSKGGPYKPIRIGDLTSLARKKRLDNAYDLILFGCLLMGGLFFLGLYRFGRYDKVILFFALFCLSYTYRIVGTNNYVLHQLLPDLSWHITVRLEYFTLFISILFFCFYTLRLYPKETDGWVVRLAVFINGGLAALVLLSPPVVFTQTINAYLTLMFAFTFYIFWVYLKAYRNKILGSGYALWSTAVVLVVMLLINFQYFGVLMLDRVILFIGYILFFFLQSLILSYRFAEQLNIARRDAEKALRAKSEFLSTMSHEIRTPLNSVIGMTHILLKDKPRADQYEQLNVLLFAARNLLSIVNDILDYNKIEAGKISVESIPVDIAALSKNIFLGLRSQGDEKGLEMQIEIEHRFHKKLLTDPTRLSQVLVNLLHNAIKFTKVGSVRLRVSLVAKEEQKCCVRFEVIDSGIGIAASKQQLIFERFTQADSSTSRSFGGTGLGLSIARRILEYQGTQLLLESEEDKGSRFYFDIWLTESDEEVADPNEERLDYLEDDQQGKPLQGLEILLVEDNALNVMVAKAFLQRWGAVIEVATNGAEALMQMDAQKHGLVLMDLHMPVMDGYEATRQLRARGEQVAIIALTASLPKEVEHDAFGAGVDAVVVKPFNPDDLRKTILEILLAKGTRFKQNS
mgnify:CR=1 FL=1